MQAGAGHVHEPRIRRERKIAAQKVACPDGTLQIELEGPALIRRANA